ncbi:hypothetical protein BMWSH_5055 [Priestia megaterium WSH-002]|uniref:Uncharacterized protein n=1 Tax=Priestia megaterium (strain WSH-002) TaxID=1006007 RepID=A0A8D3X3Z7_PRIMW|nr:hypothetical protein BMWSH_5055 [Priestia megaterium WSH-002]
MRVVDEIIVGKEILSRWLTILEEIVTRYLEKETIEHNYPTR